MTVALPLGTAPAWSRTGNRAEAGQWAKAVVPVAAVHAIVIIAAILWTAPPPPPPPDQPIAVELSPTPVADALGAVAAPAAASAAAASGSPAPAAASPAAPSTAVPFAAAPPVIDVPVAVPLPPSVRIAPPLAGPSLPAPKPNAGAGSGGETAGGPSAGASTGSEAGTAGNIGASAAGSTGDTGAVWRGRIQRHVDRYKTYPPAARMMKREGRVTLSIRINREGRILDASIAKGTGFRPIDDEALATLRRAEPLPTPPAELPGASIPLTLPIGFYLPR